MVTFINNTLPQIFDKTGNVIQKAVETNVTCNSDNFYKILIMLFWIGVVILIYFFRKNILDKINNTKGNFGYIKIWMKFENQKIKEKLIKIDQFKNFEYKRGSYNLDKMQSFIYGYDSNNIPIFLYDKNFIIPLKVDKVKVTDEIKKSFDDAKIEYDESDIQAIMLRIDSSTYNLAWNRKLMKDLYDISKSNKMDLWKWLLIGLGVVVVFIMLQTGALEQLIQNLNNLGGK
jgi:hypothetical protein